jgi:glucose-1-phosphate cytidylyltransferase
MRPAGDADQGSSPRPEIFRSLGPGEDLVHEPFQRLIQRRQLSAYAYDGFWVAVDTAKDKERIDRIVAAGAPPWQPWHVPAGAASG